MTARLAIGIPTFNRARMLDALLRELVPLAAAHGIPIHLSDNASTDETPAICAHWATVYQGLSYRRQDHTRAIPENLMSALAGCAAEYAWLVGDDDYVVPRALDAVAGLLAVRSPSAVILRWVELPAGMPLDLERPLGPQLSGHAEAGLGGGQRTFTDAAELFRDKVYDLPLSSTVYRAAPTLATDFQRYHPTHHSHLGALYDALAAEQAARGAVEVVELHEVGTVALTATRPQGKDNWTALFHELATRGFPLWFTLLPAIYQPHVPAGLARHRHIFRAAFPDGGQEPR